MWTEVNAWEAMCGIAFALVPGNDEDAKRLVLSRLEPNVRRRGPDAFDVQTMPCGNHELVFASSLLQLQGDAPRRPSLRDKHSDRILLYNGEVYDGLPGLCHGANDGEALFQALGDPGTVAGVMSGLRGPWAFVYYDEGMLWWGRDVMGRKSLLMMGEGSRMVLASVAPLEESGMDTKDCALCTEVAPGLYRARVDDLICRGADAAVRVEWESEVLLALAQYDRLSSPSSSSSLSSTRSSHYEDLLELLADAVARRCATAAYVPVGADFSAERDARFMVLFSGGVDSTLLAALVHKALPLNEPIDLCNICFATGEGEESSPDRLGAMDAYVELKAQFPGRPWRFIAINSTYKELKSRQDRLLALLRPQDTVMDFNIGGALWLAAAGAGRLIDVVDTDSSSSPSADVSSVRMFSPSASVVEERYVSKARVVFLGHGADELFGGYGRHRTRFAKAGWQGLEQELRLDVRRIWERNFGRDDRVVADHGKESRLPFMDERVLEFALRSSLGSLMDFSLPAGEGDKRILRDCLRSLGLERASRRVKRAMQFGTRLAKASNEALFGSNTQANRRHAGGRAKVGQEALP